MPAASPALPAPSRPIGTHVQVGKNLVDGALRTALELGCEAIQVFCGNPRGWALSEGDPGIDRRFREQAAAEGIRVLVHTPYLVNPGSPTPATYEKSLALVAHNLKRAVEIGAEGVVMHTGSYVDPAGDPDGAGERHAAALRRIRDGLLPILDGLDRLGDGAEVPWLLLEPTAGQGRSLCAGVEDLTAYLGALDFHPRAGICLDTCHVFAAGEPLDEPGGATACLDRIVEIGGPDRLRLVHANDSMDVRGAFKDRHEKIGQGHIGVDAFAELLVHPATRGVPMILETPGSRGADDPDLPLLKQLRDGLTGGPAGTGGAGG